MLDFLSPFVVQGHAPHYPDAGDAVGNKQRQVIFVLPMDVHVPKPGDEEFARGIHDLRIFRWRNIHALAYRGDEISCDHNREVRLGGCASRINHRDVNKD